jgi:DNA-directed RNA polymerase specialized sigma24 family protein
MRLITICDIELSRSCLHLSLQLQALTQCKGLTHKQIAEHMGLSLRSVQRYVADALYHCYVLRYEA